DPLRYLADNLVVQVENHRIAGSLEAQHCGRQEIAGGGLHYVLDQRAVPGAEIDPPAPGIVLVLELARAFEFPRHQARLGIGQLTAARQRQEQRPVLHLERKAAELDAPAGEDTSVRRPLELMPESYGCRMAVAVRELELLISTSE